MSGVKVDKSIIHGTGVYATKDFTKGEEILEIDDSHVIKNPNEVSRQDYENHADYFDDKIVLMKSPEVYINHSCDPNSYVKTVGGVRKVLAMREIKSGEEITYDYSVNGENEGSFDCFCGTKECRRVYTGNFFKLPINIQKKYVPYLDDWFIKKHKKEIKFAILKG